MAQNQSVKNFTTDDGLPSANVHCVYQDNIGFLWFGTDNGASRFNGYEFENFSFEDGLLDNEILQIEERDEKIYFLSESNAVFYFYDGKIHEAETVNTPDFQTKNAPKVNPNNELLNKVTITASLKDKEGSSWFTSLGDGVFYYPNYPFIAFLETEENTPFNSKNSNFNLTKNGNIGLLFTKDKLYYNEHLIYANNGEFVNASKLVSAFHIVKHKNSIAFVGDYKTIYQVDVVKKMYNTIAVNSLKNVSALGFDNSDNLWVGTKKGVFKIKDNKLQDNKNVHAFFNYRTTAITHSKKYNLIFYANGLGLVFKTSDTIFSIGKKEGFTANVANHIKTDANGNIWVSTNKGVFKMNGENPHKITHFTTKNGLLSNEIKAIDIINNKAYVKSRNGLNVIDIKNYEKNKKPLDVFIQYIKLDNEKFNFPKDQIEISTSKYSYLTLNFLAFNYKSKGDINYKYKINYKDQNWVETKDQKAQFTSLPPDGTYIFEIMAQNEDGVWSSPHKFTMIFLPPYYIDLRFIVLISILGLTLSFMIIRWFYRRKIKRQKLNSELLKLKGKALQSQMNPHFVFNALNSIQSFITTEDGFKAEIYLAKFSNLLRRSLNNSRSSYVKLSEDLESLDMYLQLEKIRFDEKLNYKINVDDNVEQDFIKIPPMLIQPFVENAIIHGITPKMGGGQVIINIRLKNKNHLSCVVIDNGVGRKEKNTILHKSLGTGIVKKRLSLISENKKETVIYTDLLDENKKPIGTKVEFLIPI